MSYVSATHEYKITPTQSVFHPQSALKTTSDSNSHSNYHPTLFSHFFLRKGRLPLPRQSINWQKSAPSPYLLLLLPVSSPPKAQPLRVSSPVCRAEMEEDRCLNNWDLSAVVRLACRSRLSPQVNNPFDSFPPLPPQQGPPAALKPANEQEADAGWCFPDLRAGRGQDGDEILGALLAAAQPTMPPPALPTPPPPPATQQQQPVTVTPAEVAAPAPAAPASAPPARPQPRRRQMPGAAVPRSKRR
jgi:hypothetical protein